MVLSDTVKVSTWKLANSSSRLSLSKSHPSTIQGNLSTKYFTEENVFSCVRSSSAISACCSNTSFRGHLFTMQSQPVSQKFRTDVQKFETSISSRGFARVTTVICLTVFLLCSSQLLCLSKGHHFPFVHLYSCSLPLYEDSWKVLLVLQI